MNVLFEVRRKYQGRFGKSPPLPWDDSFVNFNKAMKIFPNTWVKCVAGANDQSRGC